MENKKPKKQRKYFSLVLIPHSQGKVRVFKFSSLHTKMASLAVLIITVITCSAWIVSYIIRENQVYKSQLASIETINSTQRNLLNEKAREIQYLKTNEESIDKIKQDFADKYREITEKYITDSIITSRASQSGAKGAAGFAADIKELRILLNNITEIGKTEDPLVDLSEVEKKLVRYLDSLPTRWPASGRISSKFGTRTDPFLDIKAVHEGIDIGAPNKSDILASGSGTVTFSGSLSGYGSTVLINHGNGISTLYGHASKLLVKSGQAVSKGECIAKVGSSGRSTGPHLHFEVRLNNAPIDPLQFLDQK